MPPEVATYELNADAESLQSTPETFPKRLKLSFVRGAAKAHFVRTADLGAYCSEGQVRAQTASCCAFNEWQVPADEVSFSELASV